MRIETTENTEEIKEDAVKYFDHLRDLRELRG